MTLKKPVVSVMYGKRRVAVSTIILVSTLEKQLSDAIDAQKKCLSKINYLVRIMYIMLNKVSSYVLRWLPGITGSSPAHFYVLKRIPNRSRYAKTGA